MTIQPMQCQKISRRLVNANGSHQEKPSQIVTKFPSIDQATGRTPSQADVLYEILVISLLQTVSFKNIGHLFIVKLSLMSSDL